MEKGQSFEEFALRCARAFGALIMMRDDPLDAPIRTFEPSKYYAESIAQHRAELSRLEAMSKSEQENLGLTRKVDALKRMHEWMEKDSAANRRLDEMDVQIRQWTPPTTEHQGLKDFMLEQLKISRNDLSYIANEMAALEAKLPSAYYAEAVASERQGIEYSTQEQQKEITRTRDRNTWVKQLRDSLTATVAD